MQTATNVTSAKPGVVGAIFRAPLGTKLPMDAKTALDKGFKSLGYVSEDGIVNSTDLSSDKIKAFGGSVVLTTNGGKEDSFQLTLLESLKTDVQKAVYGERNVSGDLDNGITIKVNDDEAEEGSWVIDLILRGGVLKRIVIPQASISEIGDISYKDDEAVGYEITLSCIKDADGQTHYEYIQKPGAEE